MLRANGIMGRRSKSLLETEWSDTQLSRLGHASVRIDGNDISFIVFVSTTDIFRNVTLLQMPCKARDTLSSYTIYMYVEIK